MRRQDAELFDLFDHVTTGDDVKLGKPAPNPYQHAINRLKVEPNCCVVIENAPLGIMSAVAAGLTCLALQGSSPISEQELEKAGAAAVCKDVDALRAYLVWADANVHMKEILRWRIGKL